MGMFTPRKLASTTHVGFGEPDVKALSAHSHLSPWRVYVPWRVLCLSAQILKQAWVPGMSDSAAPRGSLWSFLLLICNFFSHTEKLGFISRIHLLIYSTLVSRGTDLDLLNCTHVGNKSTHWSIGLTYGSWHLQTYSTHLKPPND